VIGTQYPCQSQSSVLPARTRSPGLTAGSLDNARDFAGNLKQICNLEFTAV
jgi:hypothetical protein